MSTKVAGNSKSNTEHRQALWDTCVETRRQRKKGGNELANSLNFCLLCERNRYYYVVPQSNHLGF